MTYTIANIVERHMIDFEATYGHTLSSEQRGALYAILGCRTEQYGKMTVACRACEWQGLRYQSCGHRACNQCQNHAATEWLERQMRKLLPVPYFMVTFTLPRQLRSLAKKRPKLIYGLMFTCAVQTLRAFGLNDKKLMAELAMTAVLHTHSRRLDYHPHLHLIVPGGGADKKRKNWRGVKNDYLFNHFKLAKVFRGKFLSALREHEYGVDEEDEDDIEVPSTPKKWVADCKCVGTGLPALKYLSRYLYRGVIQDKQIINANEAHITFSYKDSQTNQMKSRCLLAADFLKLLVQHVLPKGFRRIRDYDFLHGNAKRLLKKVQWALKIMLPAKITPRPTFTCPDCEGPLHISCFHERGFASG